MLPARRLLLLTALLVVAGVAPYFKAGLSDLWLGAALGLLLLAVFDGMRARRAPKLRIERDIQGVWPVDRWGKVTLTVHNEDQRACDLTLFDDYPTEWELEGMPWTVRVEPGMYHSLSYHVRPTRRGNAVFGAAHVRATSPLGLWIRQHRMGPEQIAKVFPDFSQVLGHTLNATDRRAPTMGSIRRRRRGEGTDFRQLREYRQGDSMRAIDWKASARMQKPITREYQEERDQQVVFLLDTGRPMLSADEKGHHFDHALHATLTLGFIAQKQGDAVGMMSFGTEVRWLPPQKGRIGLDRLLAGAYDLHPSEHAPDYVQAATELLSRLSKRAFVVLITNLRDEDDLAMRKACELLSARHLVLCASLRERALDDAMHSRIGQFSDALRQASTALYLEERESAIRKLGLRATQLIDIEPEKLAMTLVNRYQEIKESGLL